MWDAETRCRHGHRDAARARRREDMCHTLSDMRRLRKVSSPTCFCGFSGDFNVRSKGPHERDWRECRGIFQQENPVSWRPNVEVS